MPEPTGIVIPGLPPEALGPTGNIISGDVKPPYHTLVPLLTPDQEGVGDLLAGKKPTKKQLGTAIDYARKTGGMFPFFDTPEDAQLFEQQWHDTVAKKYAPLVKSFIASPMPKFDYRGPNDALGR